MCYCFYMPDESGLIMSRKKAFQTVLAPAEGSYKEKGSKFLSKVYPVQTEEDIKQLLSSIRKEYYDARHVCYAFSLQEPFLTERGNDDGEPAHTAGTPILNQIKSFELSNVLVVVVRYFGGTKLGVSGLIQAYKAAAEDALLKAECITVEPKERYQIILPYDYTGHVMRWIKELNGIILSENKTEDYEIFIETPLDREAVLKEKCEPFRNKIEVIRLS
ncbi:MAG: YigZ family protein [Chitinophagaceae bacterium]|nr:YigZ family protein [Chitinophagaceae bacterium]